MTANMRSLNNRSATTRSLSTDSVTNPSVANPSVSKLGVTKPGVSRRAFGAIAAVLLTSTLVACGGQAKPPLVPSSDSIEAVVTVHAIDNSYEPAQVEIKPGQAVRWVFEGSMEHDVVAEDGSFVSELQLTGEYVHVFEEAGEFAYDCSIHPEMTGLVVVR